MHVVIMILIGLALFWHSCIYIDPDVEIPAVWSELRAHKIETEKNDQATIMALLKRTKRLHDAAEDIPETLALVALTTVWANQWHHRGKKWNKNQFKAHDVLTTRALQADGSPTAILARTWLTSNACTLMPKQDPDRISTCHEALNGYEQFRTTDQQVDAWFRFEALWTEVQFLNRYRANFGGEIDEEEVLARTLSVCDEGLGIVGTSPINNTYLFGDCTTAMAEGQKWPQYFKTVRKHLNLKKGNKEDHSIAARGAFKHANPACEDLKMVGKHRWKHQLPLPTTVRNGQDAFCIVVGHMALRCAEFGVDIAKQYRRGDREDWAGLGNFAVNDLDPASAVKSCAYTDTYHDPTKMFNIFSAPYNPKNISIRTKKSGKARRSAKAPRVNWPFKPTAPTPPPKATSFGDMMEQEEAEHQAEVEDAWED
jgi:hypothetical protein